MLKYKLVENQMTERPDDYMAITESAGSYTLRLVTQYNGTGKGFITPKINTLDCTLLCFNRERAS